MMLYAVRRRRQECFSSPPQWGGGELRDSKESHSFNYFFIHYLLCGQKATYEEIRHATERKLGLASQPKDFSVEIPFIFRSDEQKMWNDAGGVFGFLSAVGTILGKIYLRRLRGSRFARAAEDNAAQRRSCSGSSLAPAEARSCSRMLTLRPPQAAPRNRSPILKMELGIKKFYPQKQPPKQRKVHQ